MEEWMRLRQIFRSRLASFPADGGPGWKSNNQTAWDDALVSPVDRFAPE
jgi:hypothetical protein